MGQGEVIDILKKFNKPMSRTEIATALDANPRRISVLLNKLIRWGEILCKEIDRFEAEELYGVKHRMSIFYLE